MNAKALETYHSKDNYYSQGDGLENSQWQGQFSEHQNLTGSITAEQWQQACHGKDSNNKALRRQQKNSRAGWDITLSASKSASIKGLVDQDQRVLEAHRQAVNATVNYIEEHCIFAQVKQQRKVISEQTKQGQFALFEHDDNRNQEPQLHTHVVILNQTLCADGKSRTLDSRELFNQKKTIGAYYDHTFARQLQKQDFEIDWTGDHTFEIQGYEPEQLESFSSRRQDIRAYLEQQNIPIEQATEHQKQIACLDSRVAKVHKLIPADRDLQRQNWQKTSTELNIIHPQPHQELEQAYKQTAHPGSIQRVIDDAIESATAQQVAVSRPRLLQDCLRHAQAFYSPIEIEQALDQSQELIPTEDGRLTTHRAIHREQIILDSANEGRDSKAALITPEQVRATSAEKNLNTGQTNGLLHLGISTDLITLLQGNAGVGKTYTLSAFRGALDNTAQSKLRGLAPSAAAAEVLGQEIGMVSGTVDRYLLMPNEQLQREETLVIDEAGMLSTQQMVALIEKAKDLNSRLILVGDIKQLNAVQAGAPFRLLQERSQLKTVTIDENLRQVTPQLKEAVDLAAEQQTQTALELLDSHGCVQEIPILKTRNHGVAQRYLSRPHERQVQTLIICDTNQDRRDITNLIRSAYIDRQTLGAEAQDIEMLHPKKLDKQAISQAYNYEVGDVVRFRRSTKRFSEPFYRVIEVTGDQLQLQDRFGDIKDCLLDKYKDREVFSTQELELRVGDRLRFTRNHREWGQINGQLLTIDSFNQDGTISINTRGKFETLMSDQLVHVDYAYCRTVHAAQGWTAQEAIWAPGQNPGKEQTYVALSRAKTELEIVTVDRQALGLSAERSRGQENAQDLVVTEPTFSAQRDAELLMLQRDVKTWLQQAHPEPPDPEVGKDLQWQVRYMAEQRSDLVVSCREQQQELEEMTPQRSLFNWGGERPEVIEAKRQLLQESRQQLGYVEGTLRQLQGQLQERQQEKDIYQQWDEAPKTQLMREKVVHLQEPDVQDRLQQLKLAYGLYANCVKILDRFGVEEDGVRVFQGQRYRFESESQRVRLFRNDMEQPIFQTIDMRQSGGILEVRQLDVRADDYQRINASVRSVEQQISYSIRQEGFSLGR
ncbi:relaxase domain-containing protein (plasmid) [Acaryochloris marina S15]|nr:relaxase domain-containing protein [Acaryochloris marina S15]